MEASFAEPELKARVLRQLRQAYGLSSDELWLWYNASIAKEVFQATYWQ